MKYEPIYNEYTNGLIFDIIVWLEKTDKSQQIFDTLDICHLIGKIQNQQKRISKAIEYIEENIEGNYFKRYDDDIYRACNDLKEILKGVDKE